METLMIKVTGINSDGSNLKGSLGYLFSTSIHLMNPSHQKEACILIKLKGKTKITLDNAKFFFEVGSYRQYKSDIEEDYGDTDLLEVPDTTYDSYLFDEAYINVELYIHIVRENEIIDTNMLISDITNVETFNASSLETLLFEGINIDSCDLMKLSMVKNLGLRYCVRNPELFNYKNFMFFEKQELMFIGSARVDDGNFYSIDISENAKTSLVYLNCSMKILPISYANLGSTCKYVYILGSPSWKLLEDKEFDTNKLYALSIPEINDDDENEIETATRFVIAHVSLNSDYSLNTRCTLAPSIEERLNTYIDALKK